ncbi:MAG: transposase [Desulfuromonadaceae bacterium]|nr:transposase [Desulfuromonadaceae bacterium]
MRQIRVTVKHPAFRTQGFYIIITLLDVEQYPAEELAKLYFKRWDVELFFRDIKTTMGMDVLRCRMPEMGRKEILMHFIAYNCIRRLMYEAA